jgi:hypothetical protein
MHREVDLAPNQRLLDLLGEQPLAADLGQRPVADDVTGGADDLKLDRLGRDAMSGGKPRPHHVGLGQRQRAAARTDAHKWDGRGLHPMTSQCYANWDRRPHFGPRRTIIGIGRTPGKPFTFAACDRMEPWLCSASRRPATRPPPRWSSGPN